MVHIVQRQGARRIVLWLPLLAVVSIVGGCRGLEGGPVQSTITLTARVPTSDLRDAPTRRLSLSYDCDCFVSQLDTSPLANRVIRADAAKLLSEEESRSSIPMDVTEIGIWLAGSNDFELEKAFVKYRCSHAGFGFEVCKK